MKIKYQWIDVSILNLSVVALLGATLRSKALFPLPWVNYNYLLDAHSHFAFGAWVTLALMVLMVQEILPQSQFQKTFYQWIFGGVALSSWAMLFTFAAGGNSKLSDYFSVFFIFATYLFAWKFIRDLLKAPGDKSVTLLSVASLICLVISSIGPFALSYLFAVKSLNAILYKNALYTYLHFQYNGFFTLALFALLFNKIKSKTDPRQKKNIHRFSILLVISILPSQFLTYLWQGANRPFLLIAIAGSILLLLCLVWFIISAWSLKKIHGNTYPMVRFLGIVSMSVFAVKTFLQSLTIFPVIGNAVFGDRPLIIGFLHLVFLGFVTTFLLAYFSQRKLLNTERKFTRAALIIFTVGIIFNETILMFQGLGAMLIKSSFLFQWLLWIASIWMLMGAVLIVAARVKSKINHG